MSYCIYPFATRLIALRQREEGLPFANGDPCDQSPRYLDARVWKEVRLMWRLTRRPRTKRLFGELGVVLGACAASLPGRHTRPSLRSGGARRITGCPASIGCLHRLDHSELPVRFVCAVSEDVRSKDFLRRRRHLSSKTGVAVSINRVGNVVLASTVSEPWTKVCRQSMASLSFRPLTCSFITIKGCDGDDSPSLRIGRWLNPHREGHSS